MKNHILCTAKKYQGHHIAYESFNSKKIVAFGDNPVLVINKAKKRGFDKAVLSYVPDENMTFVY
jgi:hypothetical protein